MKGRRGEGENCQVVRGQIAKAHDKKVDNTVHESRYVFVHVILQDPILKIHDLS